MYGCWDLLGSKEGKAWRNEALYIGFNDETPSLWLVERRNGYTSFS
jgi:hypothetical protein